MCTGGAKKVPILSAEAKWFKYKTSTKTSEISGNGILWRASIPFLRHKILTQQHYLCKHTNHWVWNDIEGHRLTWETTWGNCILLCQDHNLVCHHFHLDLLYLRLCCLYWPFPFLRYYYRHLYHDHLMSVWSSTTNGSLSFEEKYFSLWCFCIKLGWSLEHRELSSKRVEIKILSKKVIMLSSFLEMLQLHISWPMRCPIKWNHWIIQQ